MAPPGGGALSAAVYDWFLRCCWFYVSTNSVCFSRFVISHALRYRFLAICCHAAGGAQPPAVGTTAQPYTAGRLPFFVTAARKSAEEVPLHFIDALRSAPDIVRSQPRTASLLSGNSVLRAVFGPGRPTPPRLSSVFWRDLRLVVCQPALPPAAISIPRRRKEPARG